LSTTVFVHDCPHCGTRKIALTVQWSSVVPGDPHQQKQNGVCTCNACLMPLAFRAQARTPNLKLTAIGRQVLVGTENGTDLKVVSFFPSSRVAASPEDVPPEVERVFLQALRSDGAGDVDAAVTMYRKTLQVALVKRHPEMAGKNLVVVIRSLADAGELPKALAETAHLIRLDGNDAAHDMEEISPERCGQIGQLTDMVLRYLFTMPAAVGRLQAEAAT
jgi:hypothetical protein